jgi:hypothetical protein
MAHTDEPFDFAQTYPLNIKLQSFYHIIGINLFSLFKYSKIVMRLFAWIPLTVLYDTTFYNNLMVAFRTSIFLYNLTVNSIYTNFTFIYLISKF